MRTARRRDYYETTPDSKFGPGDIWSDLPTFGLLPRPEAVGIVITAACDFANQKTETVTYLPMVPLLEYFTLPPAIPVVLKRCQGQLVAAGLPDLIAPVGRGFLPPPVPQLRAARESLAAHLGDQNLSAGKREAAGRADAGIAILLRAWQEPTGLPTTLAQDLALLWGKDWGEMCENLITNSLPTLHFLPADGQPQEYSGVPEHSLILFRYPITVPSEILYCANDVGIHGWQSGIRELAAVYPMAKTGLDKRPMKRSALRKPFMVDVIARYVSLYGRVGSPSLAPVSLKRIVGDLKGAT